MVTGCTLDGGEQNCLHVWLPSHVVATGVCVGALGDGIDQHVGLCHLPPYPALI